MGSVDFLLLLLALGALSTADALAAAAATSNPPPPPWRHHVFISHRGPDGRRNFTDHLDSALRRGKRVRVFRDDVDLRRGENITEAISRAIEESMLSVVVLSKGYASSEYCLDELVKIMKCRNSEKGHQPFPVFYKVSPDDDVADPASSGLYKEDFDRHKRMYSYERVNGWIHALRSISHISGWVIDDHTPEAEKVEQIAQEILWKVNEMDDEESDDDDHHHGVVRMGVANGTRTTISWEKAVVSDDDQKKTTEGSSNHGGEAAQPPGENEVVTVSIISMTMKSFFIGNATFVTRKYQQPNMQLDCSNATGLMYIIATLEIIMQLGDNEEEQVLTTIDVVVVLDDGDDEDGGGGGSSDQTSLPMGTLQCLTNTPTTAKKEKKSSGN